jgi:uncharacterized membrane protein YjjP (DUF1212 family)
VADVEEPEAPRSGDDADGMGGRASPERTPAQCDRELQLFVVQLGAALNAGGETSYAIQQRLTRVLRANAASGATVSAFPTSLMVTMGRGEPAAVELSAVASTPQLDQIAAVDRLVQDAERGAIAPAEGLAALGAIARIGPRFGAAQRIVGYATLSLGICLLLRASGRDLVAAAMLGAVVGVLRSLAVGRPQVEVLLPLLAAFVVSWLAALAVRHELTNPGLRAVVASLALFLPGAAMTTAVLELASGQSIAGAGRLVAGMVQLALLAFGILAGIEAADVAPSYVFADDGDRLGAWAQWVGVGLFAIGVAVAYSTPPRSFASLALVLYAAWLGQLMGNELLGGYVSGFLGALVLTVAATWMSRLPSAMPPHAAFLPGFWLLVPGALALIGFTRLAGDNPAGTEDLTATVVSVFAVAVGVLCGTMLLPADRSALPGATRARRRGRDRAPRQDRGLGRR